MSEKDKEEAEEEVDNDAKLYKNIQAKDPEMFEEIDECFDIFDKDRDGMINYFDFGQLLRWLKFNPTEAQLRDYAEKYDKNKDGNITKPMVKSIVNEKVMEPDTIEELIEAMKILDYNQSSKIQQNELP